MRRIKAKGADNAEIVEEAAEEVAEEVLENGPYTSFADLMSPEDAERYLKFLETGSTAGLTEAEIAAIRRVDELLASKRITYQDIVDMRNANFVVEGGLNSVDSIAIMHSSVGDFTYDPITGTVSKMKGGGHGQANIDFLEANGIEYNIVHVYDNGVRIGNVPGHKVKAKRTGTNQSWFPADWSENDIANAGEYVGNLPGNTNVADGVAVFGEYNGVRVGVIRTNGKISTIFPDATSQP